MKLTRVTITGADDAVEHQALLDLSREFPFVEWGVLISPNRQGEPRYPSLAWRTKFFFMQHEARQALHMCGEFSRLALAGYDEWPGGMIYQRAQLNGFSAWHLPALRFADEYIHSEIILQAQHQVAFADAVALKAKHSNVAALWDQSGGDGRFITYFPTSTVVKVGYAGGIDPDNVVDLLSRILPDHTYADQEIWIDMESGVRTDNKLDLGKVRRVLELAAPFVVRG